MSHHHDTPVTRLAPAHRPKPRLVPRDRPPMEVWLFWSPRQAKAAGFIDGVHPLDASMVCWHPDMSISALADVRPTKVVNAAGNPSTNHNLEQMTLAVGLLESRHPAIWITL